MTMSRTAAIGIAGIAAGIALFVASFSLGSTATTHGQTPSGTGTSAATTAAGTPTTSGTAASTTTAGTARSRPPAAPPPRCPLSRAPAPALVAMASRPSGSPARAPCLRSPEPEPSQRVHAAGANSVLDNAQTGAAGVGRPRSRRRDLTRPLDMPLPRTPLPRVPPVAPCPDGDTQARRVTGHPIGGPSLIPFSIAGLAGRRAALARCAPRARGRGPAGATR